jgi:hypothetical protein
MNIINSTAPRAMAGHKLASYLGNGNSYGAETKTKM